MLVDFFNDLGFSEVDTPHVSYLALLSCCQIPICTITPMFLSPGPSKVRVKSAIWRAKSIILSLVNHIRYMPYLAPIMTQN